MPKRARKHFLLFARLMCASLIFNKRKGVLAKALLPKAALLDLSAPGLKVISSLRAGGPHAIQGKRGKVKSPLTNQAINHLAVSATVTHSG